MMTSKVIELLFQDALIILQILGSPGRYLVQFGVTNLDILLRSYLNSGKDEMCQFLGCRHNTCDECKFSDYKCIEMASREHQIIFMGDIDEDDLRKLIAFKSKNSLLISGKKSLYVNIIKKMHYAVI